MHCRDYGLNNGVRGLCSLFMDMPGEWDVDLCEGAEAKCWVEVVL